MHHLLTRKTGPGHAPAVGRNYVALPRDGGAGKYQEGRAPEKNGGLPREDLQLCSWLKPEAGASVGVSVTKELGFSLRSLFRYLSLLRSTEFFLQSLHRCFKEYF